MTSTSWITVYSLFSTYLVIVHILLNITLSKQKNSSNLLWVEWAISSLRGWKLYTNKDKFAKPNVLTHNSFISWCTIWLHGMISEVICIWALGLYRKMGAFWVFLVLFVALAILQLNYFNLFDTSRGLTCNLPLVVLVLCLTYNGHTMANGAMARVSRWSSHYSHCSHEDDVANSFKDMFMNSTTLMLRVGSNSS
jgi:hypothetical protein